MSVTTYIASIYLVAVVPWTGWNTEYVRAVRRLQAAPLRSSAGHDGMNGAPGAGIALHGLLRPSGNACPLPDDPMGMYCRYVHTVHVLCIHT